MIKLKDLVKEQKSEYNNMYNTKIILNVCKKNKANNNNNNKNKKITTCNNDADTCYAP